MRQSFASCASQLNSGRYADLADIGPMTKRQHHCVPRFLLEHFATAGDSADQVYVFDLDEHRRWLAGPHVSARRRDYYRIDVAGEDPNAIEDLLGRIETEAAPGVRSLVETGRLPTGEDLDRLLRFMAVLGARVPGARDAIAEPMARLGEDLLAILLATPDRWERFVQEQKEKGIDVSGYPSYEQVKEGFEGGGFEIQLNQNIGIGAMLQMAGVIESLLHARNWSVAVAPADGPFLITSDRPLTISWTRPVPAFYGPGFAMRDTEVTIPVSPTVGLLGSFKGLPSQFTPSEHQVALFNGRTLDSATRFLFSSSDQFILLRQNNIVRSDAYLELLANEGE